MKIWDEPKNQTKQRIIEYSVDESDEEGDSDWAVETNETAKIAAGGENEPSARDKERTPKSVGGKRKQGEEATRKSTRQRRGVDKVGGLMIHRIELKYMMTKEKP